MHNVAEQPTKRGHARASSRDIRPFPLAALRPYPKHFEMAIPELSTKEREELRSDIAEHGLEHPLDVWIEPDGQVTVLAGHERFLAIDALGWPTVECRVRHDLDAENKRDAYVIRDNLRRRHLTDSQRSAMAMRLIQIQGEGLMGSDYGAVVDEVTSELSISKPSVYARARVELAARETPEFGAVMKATDAGKVSLSTASWAAGLPPEDRNAVAAALLSAPPGKENKAVAVASREAHNRNTASEVSLNDDMSGSEPASVTHPASVRANVQAINSFEARLFKELSAHGRTVHWILGIMRRAAARMRGKDMAPITRFVREMVMVVGPMHELGVPDPGAED